MFKHVIITGGSGFIGSHVVDAMLERAERVTVIDKQKPPRQVKRKEATYRILNIQDERISAVFQKAKPDLVIHLAAHIDDRHSVIDPVANAKDNVLGTLRVLEAARASGMPRVVFASTGILYGNQSSYPAKETDVPHPATPYAVSKLTGERYLHFYHVVHGLSYAALRFGNVYGPRQDSSKETGAIGVFTTNLLKGEPAFVNNDGSTTRDYVYVGDVVESILRAAGSDVVGVFNVGTGIETSTSQLFTDVSEAVGVNIAPQEREEVVDVIKRAALDSSLAHDKLGWAPETSLETGIEKTVAWYREFI